jgi:hypothetical protein
MTDDGEKATDAGVTDPEPAGERVSTYHSLVRFTAGIVGVAVDRVQNAGDKAAARAEGAALADDGEPVFGDVIFGFAADLPDRFERVTTTVASSGGLVRDIVAFGWRVTMASPVGWVLSKPVEAVRDVVDTESERLAAIGRYESARGKTLFEGFVDETINVVLDNVSESEALNDLIRDQALGMTDAVIEEVRESGAAADTLTDRIVRRLLRRDPRPLPPMPTES